MLRLLYQLPAKGFVNTAPAYIWGIVFYSISKSVLTKKSLLIVKGKELNNIKFEQTTDPSFKAVTPSETAQTTPLQEHAENPLDETQEPPSASPDIPANQISFDDSVDVFEPQESADEASSEEPVQDDPVNPSATDPLPKQPKVDKALVCVLLAILFCVIAFQTGRKISSLERQVESLTRENKKIETQSQTANYWLSCIGFVPKDSQYYHHYTCEIFANLEYTFLQAHNMEYCEYLGCLPCEECRDSFLPS